PATPGRPVRIENAHRRDWKLEQPGLGLMREARGIGDAIVIVTYGIDARAVAVSRFGDAVDRPRILRTHREAGSSVPDYLLARNVLQHRLGQAYIGQELSSLLIGCAPMGEAVARQLMSGERDAANQGGVALPDPSEREERCADVLFREQRQDAVDVLLDANGKAVPFLPRYVRCECGDLEIVLDVDAQRIDNSAAGGLEPAHARTRSTPRELRPSRRLRPE